MCMSNRVSPYLGHSEFYWALDIVMDLPKSVFRSRISEGYHVAYVRYKSFGNDQYVFAGDFKYFIGGISGQAFPNFRGICATMDESN